MLVKNNEPVKHKNWTDANEEELAHLSIKVTVEETSKGRAKKQKIKDLVEECGAVNLKQQIDALEAPAAAIMISQEI